MFKACVVIPVYKHVDVLSGFISEINYPLIVVDDGNTSQDKSSLEDICAGAGAVLVSLKKNSGKGAAMMAGFKEAAANGFTHALQVDADAQHDLKSVETFMKAAENEPESLINGYPVYDDTAVRIRQHGRKITNFWVRLHTRSADIKDSMCGFRIYPLKAVEKLLKRPLISKRMGFDIEILVKLHWQGVKIVNLPVKVYYHKDGHSNFRMFADNVKISLLHAYLFTGMVLNFIKGAGK